MFYTPDGCIYGHSSLCSCSSPSSGIHGYIVVYAPALALAQVYKIYTVVYTPALALAQVYMDIQ